MDLEQVDLYAKAERMGNSELETKAIKNAEKKILE